MHPSLSTQFETAENCSAKFFFQPSLIQSDTTRVSRLNDFTDSFVSDEQTSFGHYDVSRHVIPCNSLTKLPESKRWEKMYWTYHFHLTQMMATILVH